jgi:superfamily II DNA or RNA helicase
MSVELHFDHGTLVVPALPEDDERLRALLLADPRTGTFRAPAHRYREIALYLHRSGRPYTDRARRFEPMKLELQEELQPFPHQRQALEAWKAAGCRGIVELPTGSGKTLLAILAIAHVGRPALIVVPTIHLMHQWHGELTRHLGGPIGRVGGGEQDRQKVTVTTYDSAAAQVEFHGNRFGLLVCDECHHLPGPSYQFVAAGSIAPFRLGLSATLARQDGGEQVCFDLLGPLVYSVGIGELEGRYLSPYDVRRIEVALSREEQERHDAARALYLDFVRRAGIDFGAADGWTQFIIRSQQTDEGRRAFRAYREQRSIALTSEAKVGAMWQILLRHREERTILFTEDNETVYRLSRMLLVPAITHHTRGAERAELLAGFSRGDLPALLTSRVLNEGVDVPEANVGVVLSGSGSVREHVQRLGRILRKRPGKRALLYEICTAETAEGWISERRRQHSAYRRAAP